VCLFDPFDSERDVPRRWVASHVQVEDADPELGISSKKSLSRVRTTNPWSAAYFAIVASAAAG
jgi:hypothetical protein